MQLAYLFCIYNASAVVIKDQDSLRPKDHNSKAGTREVIRPLATVSGRVTP